LFNIFKVLPTPNTLKHMESINKQNSSEEAVTIGLEDLKQSTISFHTLEEAFGPSSLGILIVKDLPARFFELRHRLLSYASYLANLPSEELGGSLFLCCVKDCFTITCSLLFSFFQIDLSSSINLDALSCPSAKYLSGWSHGKEALKSGTYDTLKGSYYVNCAFYKGQDLAQAPHPLSAEFPEFTAPNIWPDQMSLPGFQETFEEICVLIIDTAVLVARACDRYAAFQIEDYPPGYLELVVKTSLTTKARLLHYFPPEPSQPHDSNSANGDLSDAAPRPGHSDHDSWCATHVDHGCLTGLTSAMYFDEAAHPPHRPSNTNGLKHLPPLPFLPAPPSSDTGLYIHARDSTITKVSIPPDCLAFQTGEALQVITGGKFRAVPHFVRAGGGGEGMRVARNTLAVFTQPDLEEVVDREMGTNFGEFSREVVNRFG